MLAFLLALLLAQTDAEIPLPFGVPRCRKSSRECGSFSTHQAKDLPSGSPTCVRASGCSAQHHAGFWSRGRNCIIIRGHMGMARGVSKAVLVAALCWAGSSTLEWCQRPRRPWRRSYRLHRLDTQWASRTWRTCVRFPIVVAGRWGT